MRLTVGDTTLFFDAEGVKLAPDGPMMREKPTLLLLHGGPGFDHAGFKPHFSVLADEAQIIYLDHRGQGRSDPSQPDRWTLDQWADDIKEFCGKLEIVRPIVYGISFGGMVAQAYAARHPGHASGIIIDSSGPRMRLDLSYDAFERLGGKAARAAAERFWTAPGDDSAWNDYLALCYPLYTRVKQDPEAASRSIIRRPVLDHFFALDGEGRRFDLRHRLARVQCPVLILSGQDDPITPPALAQEIMTALPSGLGRLVSIDNAGHGVFRDKPAEVFALIREFLAVASSKEVHHVVANQ